MRLDPKTKRPIIAFGYNLHDSGAPIRATIDAKAQGDYGQDPLGNGMHRMVPSGDVVTTEEMRRRIGK